MISMFPDSRVREILAELPELQEQPEWTSFLEWLQEEFHLISDMGSILFGRVVEPYLLRMIQNDKIQTAARVLEYVEETLREPGGSLSASSYRLLESQILRTGLFEQARELMGAKSRQFVEDLREEWASWEPVIASLEDFYLKINAAIVDKYPDIRAGGRPRHSTNWTFFDYQCSYMYDPARQSFDDLLLDFNVSKNRAGNGLLRWPQDPDSDVAAYEMTLGPGIDPIPALGPVFLHGDPTQPEYINRVLEFAKRCQDYTWENLPRIIQSLEVPCDVEAEDLFTLPKVSKWMTHGLRSWEGYLWRMLRETLQSRNQDPQTSVIAQALNQMAFYVLITEDKDILAFKVKWRKGKGSGGFEPDVHLGLWPDFAGPDTPSPSEQDLEECLRAGQPGELNPSVEAKGGPTFPPHPRVQRAGGQRAP